MSILRFLCLAVMIPTCAIAQQRATPAASATIANPKTPEEFFARARQLSDLEAAGIPFHLKATYVATGDTEFTGKGTYEEWWKSKDVWRKEATLEDYKSVSIRDGKQTAASATSAYSPLRLRQVIGLQIFNLIRLPAIQILDLFRLPEKSSEEWQLSLENEGGNTLEVATKQVPCDPRHKKILCIAQYKFAENGLLRGFRINDISEKYSDFQPFGKLSFSRKQILALRDNPVLTVDIKSLESLPQNVGDLFAVNSASTLPVLLPEVFANSDEPITPPKPVHRTRLKYPKSERKSHGKKTVIVECTIDKNGAVREPFIQFSREPGLDETALQDFRQWKFNPAMRNGKPLVAELLILFQVHVF
jgi:TonB family protein